MVLKDASVNRYGVPLTQATNDDMAGWWLVDIKIDHAAKAVEEELAGVAKEDRPFAIPQVHLDPNYVDRTPKPAASPSTESN